ncbi:V-type ATP synthase subunit C [Halorhabdus sp. CUG00001]|uniref:V-type ATP synthase subunit C n=1 Tax=Halorhabdus sp. CUG00001 TaxID=2600297 RepID=UPI00131DE10B|nr:V-type ATP synthase subunit C [Halorhabdus sp. CUG00001]
MSGRRSFSADGQTNYEYVVARVRSRRAALFDENDYRKLVRMGTGEIARFMEESEYEREMNALGARYSGVDLIEYALTENMARHFEDLLRWADGEVYNYVARYLRRFDAWNVKTVLRGIYSGADADAIDSDLIRAGELDAETLDRLENADTIEAAIEGLEGTIFQEPLVSAFDDFEAQELLVPLENAVDRSFYEQLIEGLPDENRADRATQLYLEFLQAEIDFRNLRNALRLARSGADMDPAEYYIDGGQLFDAGEVRTLVGDVERLVEHVRESTYGEDLSTALDDLESAVDLIGFEHALDAALLEYADTLSYRYPVSITAVLSYILAKEREIDNIRAIARGRESGLEPDEIERDLVML